MNIHTKDEIINACDGIKTKTELYKKLGYSYFNGKVIRHIKNLLEKYEIDIDTIIKNNTFRTKICPICEKPFTVSIQTDKVKEQITCSHSCANTYFRSGINNGSHAKAIIGEVSPSSMSYRTICFYYHKKVCVVCGEFRIVSVHHYDGNHSNNSPENLIPLCQTHHQYFHSKYKDIYQDEVDEYRNEWMKNNVGKY